MTWSNISILRPGSFSKTGPIRSRMRRVSGVSTATSFSYQLRSRLVFRDTFSGESTIGIPARSAIFAASGSTQKLNSAFGVMLPAPSGSEATAPPMM